MSGIVKRSLLLDMTSKRHVVAHDWAITTTELGVMAEPFIPFQRISPNFSFVSANDPTDQISRIDDIMSVPIGKERSILAFGGETNLHGGALAPRTGY
jgi:hypothetical protein